MNIFKRSYKVRRYGRTSWEDGVASAGYEDVQLMLDVQAKTRRNQDDPAGRTTAGTLTVYSDMELHPAESDDQTDGDRLFYMGKWYVCKSSIYWGNTILSHWISEFEAVDGENERGRGTMTEAECRAEIRNFFMELYPACTVIYSYPGNAARPPAPYVVLDFNAADSSQIDEYVDDGILQQTWYMTMPFSAELVAQSKVVHGGGVKKALPSTVVDDLAQSIRFFQSPYAEDKMRLLNISVTATGNPEQIYNSVSGVERARCSFSVDFIQSTKEYAALHPQDGEYITDHDSAASKKLADMQAGYFTEVEIEPQIKE